MKNVFTAAIITLGLATGTEASADDRSVDLSASAGIASIGESEGPFIRGTALFPVVSDFQLGIEGELFTGLETFDQSETDGVTVFRDETTLSGSGAVYGVARYGSDKFGVHTRIGVRHYNLKEEFFIDDVSQGDQSLTFQGIDFGIGANYQLDEKNRHGIRADIGVSGLVDLSGESYYPLLGGTYLAQLGYNIRF